MADIVLGAREQAALRGLLAVDQPPAGRAQKRTVLEQLARLIGCDAVGVGNADETGLVITETSLPADHLSWAGPQACDGPLPLGFQHWSRDPVHAPLLRQVGLRDTISVTFRNGSTHTVQVFLDRWRRPFADRDAALLGMVVPVLERLFRDKTTVVTLPADLTVSERRVLQLVATGLSNAEVAERLTVSPSTVRKHLENSYRKLGVPNRVAAVRRFEGWLADEPERTGRLAAAEAR